MSEMPDAREDHREAVLVSSGDHFGVAHGAAGLYDRGDAVPGGLVNAVAEGEEGVGREHGAFDRKLRAHRADAHRDSARTRLNSSDDQMSYPVFSLRKNAMRAQSSEEHTSELQSPSDTVCRL